jgi:hypothetical protein
MSCNYTWFQVQRGKCEMVRNADVSEICPHQQRRAPQNDGRVIFVKKKLCGLWSPEAVYTVTKAVITRLKWKIASASSNTAHSALAVAPVCRVAELLLAQVSHVLAESLSAVATSSKYCCRIALHDAGLSFKGPYNYSAGQEIVCFYGTQAGRIHSPT